MRKARCDEVFLEFAGAHDSSTVNCYESVAKSFPGRDKCLEER